MAIAFESTTSTTAKEDVSNVSSLSYTVSTNGVNRLLVAYIYTYDVALNLVSGVTYNGVAMSFVNKVDDGGTAQLHVYQLLNPATGSNTMTANFSTNTKARIAAISYSGAPGGVVASSTFSNTTAPYSVTTPVDNCWVILYKFLGASTAGTGATFRFSDNGSDGRFNSGYDSNGSVGTAGSKDISCSATNYGIVLAISPGYGMLADVATFALTGINTAFNVGRNIIASAASVVLNGVNISLNVGHSLVADLGNFILTGYDVILTRLGWTDRTKPSTSWTNRTKPTTSFTDRTKPTTTWTKHDTY